MIGKTIRNFRIVSTIGEGGMGVVYLAEHVELSKRFALKSLSRALSGDPDFRRRFSDEARRQALLDDPNIVQVTNFFEESGEFFLVMEYVDGQDLSRLIKSKGRLTEAEALPIFYDILQGLGSAHAKGLVHRDVKPSNVLVDRSGRARVMDFGIAIMAGGADKARTATGVAIGSPWYMSPEQILRPREVDQRADIYALGIVLYEMLTGAVPFDGDTDFEVKDKQVRAPARDPRETNSEISPHVARAVLRAMAKEPAQRFENCQEFRKALGSSPPIPIPWRKVLVAGALAAFVVSAGIVAYQFTRQPPPISPTSPIVVVAPPGEPTPVPSPLTPVSVAKVEPPTPVPPPARRPEDHARSRPPDKVNEAAGPQAEIARKTVYNTIRDGSERAWSACNQFDSLKRKEDGLQAARDIKDSSLEDAFRTRIQEHKANIANAFGEYSRFLDQLVSAADATIVGEEFENYRKSLEARNAFQQIRIERLVKDHYQRRRGGAQRVDLTAMGADCAIAFGKGP